MHVNYIKNFVNYENVHIYAYRYISFILLIHNFYITNM